MYKIIFVENVLLHGQNGIKSKQVQVFRIFKSDPGGCFWIHIKNLTSGPIFYFFTLSNAKHGGKYWNRSRGKLHFKGPSGKDYGTHGLN